MVKSVNQKIRIMFYADSFDATSGYSRVAKELSTRLVKDDRFEVFFQQIIDCKPIHRKEGVTILPSYVERFQPLFVQNILNNLILLSPDVFLPISDIFLMNRDGLNKLNFQGMTFIPYVLIDSDNLPDESEEILNKASLILTASEHGQKELLTEGYKSEILYHGVHEDFKPASEAEKINLRKKYLIKDDNTVFLFIGRNYMRKRPLRLIEAITKFNKNLKDKGIENKATFLLHISDHKMEGWNINTFIDRVSKRYGVSNDNIVLTKEHRLGDGMHQTNVVELYQLSDFYVTASSGEGFGMPIVEAMACKIPVIAPDNTTHSVLLKDKGILVENDSMMYVGYGTSQKVVDINKLADTINTCYVMEDSTKIKIINNAYNWVKENCNWDKITEQLANKIATTVRK